MMVHNCDRLEIAEDQEERQDDYRADVDHASDPLLLIFDEGNRFVSYPRFDGPRVCRRFSSSRIISVGLKAII